MSTQKSGLYFHIPFCKSKCPYCDFYSVKYDAGLGEKYVDELETQIKQYQGFFDTVYFGGGTPSILEPKLIGRILSCAREQFDIDKNSEITIECNPSKDLAEAFKIYAHYGINRISLGMQSAVDRERLALGRSASRVQVEKAINDARNAGIQNISLDLMLGTPKQTLNSLDESLDFIKAMGVSHISAYMLKLEPGTRFYEMRDRLALADDDEVAEMYLKTVYALEEMGIKQYEISNFAREGFESRHNLKYWRLEQYLGLGKSAHSFWHGKRFYYDREWNKISDGEGGSREEKIMLGLRLCEGIDRDLTDKDCSRFIEMKLLEERDGRLCLTPNGMLVSNSIINALL